MKPTSPIILASQSPRRKQLLEWAEIDFEIVVANTDETYPAHLSHQQIAMHIARNKALAVKELLVQQHRPEATIIAADTIVVLDNEVIGKPAHREDAINTLLKLSGREHKVITGVVILANGLETAFADTTIVQFHPLTTNQVVFYVDHFAPYDKAGAYAIQEWIGVVGIRAVKGDFYNVMGLPISRVIQALGINPQKSVKIPQAG